MSISTRSTDTGVLNSSYGLTLSSSFRTQPRTAPKVEKFVPLETLAELSDDHWTTVPNDRAAYNYRTRGEVAGVGCEVLLDGGAGVNSVAEEVIIGALNIARALGIGANDPRYPIIQLENGACRSS